MHAWTRWRQTLGCVSHNAAVDKSNPVWELWSKPLKGGYIGDHLGNSHRAYSRGYSEFRLQASDPLWTFATFHVHAHKNSSGAAQNDVDLEFTYERFPKP